jgi:hypothetical protein
MIFVSNIWVGATTLCDSSCFWSNLIGEWNQVETLEVCRVPGTGTGSLEPNEWRVLYVTAAAAAAATMLSSSQNGRQLCRLAGRTTLVRPRRLTDSALPSFTSCSDYVGNGVRVITYMEDPINPMQPLSTSREGARMDDLHSFVRPSVFLLL